MSSIAKNERIQDFVYGGFYVKMRWMVLAPFLLITGCAADNTTKMSVEMFNQVGDSLGSIEVTEEAEGVSFAILLEGLTPGEHGLHIHEKGDCTPPDFTGAGNHFNPDEKKHGLLHPEGAHAGDLPNIIVDENGVVDVEITAPNVTLKKGKKNSLLHKDGTSIIITEAKDDGMTQPSGDSGSRIACGKITEEEAKKADKKEVQKEEE